MRNTQFQEIKIKKGEKGIEKKKKREKRIKNGKEIIKRKKKKIKNNK